MTYIVVSLLEYDKHSGIEIFAWWRGVMGMCKGYNDEAERKGVLNDGQRD